MNTEQAEQAIPPEYAGTKVAGQQLTLFENHAEIVLPNGVVKCISLVDLANALNRSINIESELKTMLLPANCYIWGQNTSEITLGCYYPGKKRKIVITKRGTGVETTFEIPYPNIIISHRLSKTEKGTWSYADAKYYATSKSISQIPLKVIWTSDVEAQIWVLPLCNVYNDGRLCFGANKMPMSFEDNFRGLDWYYAVLYNSSYNEDLAVPSLAKPTPGFDWVQTLSQYEEFPYELLKGGQKLPKSRMRSVATEIMENNDIAVTTT